VFDSASPTNRRGTAVIALPRGGRGQRPGRSGMASSAVLIACLGRNIVVGWVPEMADYDIVERQGSRTCI
jgi:hypothetical protein